ncbi:hypothetical protein TURU_117150 [Turdus rufiventris]|nr:hypothetical protein TURU_117150 [Turdus rufiventris]
MSDMEDDFMCDDEEDYDLEYSEDSNSEPNVDLENQYYNSKALKEDDPKAALSSFQKVLELEGEKGEWGFKALKQMIKINFKLMDLLQEFYETTLEALKDAKNDRLWFKTNTKLGKLYLEREEYGKLQKILRQLHQSCQAKPYKNDPEILAMTNLVSAYQNNDITEFEKILKTNHSNIMDDPFIREHIEELLRNIRTQVLIKLIKPYTRIHIPFISKELNIDVADVESLLVQCILDNTIHGRIDQVNQLLELDHQKRGGARYTALDKWTNQLNSLNQAVVSKLA